MSITKKSLQTMHERLLEFKKRQPDLPKESNKEPNFLQAWEELASYPRFGEVAAIHQGIAYAISGHEKRLFARSPRPGFARGLRSVTKDFAPYEVKARMYLNTDPRWQRREATAQLPWQEPKVLVNATRLGTKRWPLAAALDPTGLVCTENFHAVWPIGPLPIEVLAVLLNSPIANAFLSQHSTSRFNPIHILNQIPIPNFDQSSLDLFTSLVQEYLSWREKARMYPNDAAYCSDRSEGLLGGIDTELLDLYGLSLKAERELLAYFAGYRRPGPIPLTQVKPSPTNRLWTAVIRVVNVRNEGNEKVMDVIVFQWNWKRDDPDRVIQLPLSLLPAEIREQVIPESTLQANVNTHAKDKQDLVFENFELLPEIDEESALAELIRLA